MLAIICGLSGSGKSYLIESANVASHGLTIVKASDLLRNGGYPTTNLQASDVSKNQRYIVDQLIGLSGCHRRIVLDGHLLIETREGPQLTADAVLESLPISAVIFVSSEPEIILQRKPRINSSPDEIADLSQLELVHARRLARRTGALFHVMSDQSVPADILTVLEQSFSRAGVNAH